MTEGEAHTRPRSGGLLLQAAVAYGVFCGIGLASRLVPVLFLPFVFFGIAFPLLWAVFSGDWGAIGFVRRNPRNALLWGLGAGAAWGGYTYVVFAEGGPLPPLWGLQVAIALPVWLLVLSPFQELFFRGWLQPRLELVLGRRWGLVVTALAFTLWHFFPQLEGTMTATLPLSSPAGILSTLAAGLLFGYIRRRTGSIIGPWLAHALAGIALVLMGRMAFVQYVP